MRRQSGGIDEADLHTAPGRATGSCAGSRLRACRGKAGTSRRSTTNDSPSGPPNLAELDHVADRVDPDDVRIRFGAGLDLEMPIPLRAVLAAALRPHRRGVLCDRYARMRCRSASRAATQHARGALPKPAPICPIPGVRWAIPVLKSGWRWWCSRQVHRWSLRGAPLDHPPRIDSQWGSTIRQCRNPESRMFDQSNRIHLERKARRFFGCAPDITSKRGSA